MYLFLIIGQTRPVETIRVVIKDSVEEMILKLQEKKTAMAKDALMDTGEDQDVESIDISSFDPTDKKSRILVKKQKASLFKAAEEKRKHLRLSELKYLFQEPDDSPMIDLT